MIDNPISIVIGQTIKPTAFRAICSDQNLSIHRENALAICNFFAVRGYRFCNAIPVHVADQQEGTTLT